MFVYDVCKTFMACFSNATKITIDVPISFIQLSMFHCSVKLSQLASGLLIGLDVKFAHIRVIFPAPLIMQQKWRDIINRTGGCPVYHHGKNIHTPIYVYNIHQCRLHALSCKGKQWPTHSWPTSPAIDDSKQSSTWLPDPTAPHISSSSLPLTSVHAPPAHVRKAFPSSLSPFAQSHP